MKIITRLCALLLGVILLLGCTSCMQDRDPNLPDGMKLATAAYADFRFYIPTAWNSNTAYGISGGYYNLDVQSTVSMMRYDIPDEWKNSTETELFDGFWASECKAAIEAIALSGSVKELEAPSATMLHERNARRYVTSATVKEKGQVLYFQHVLVKNGNGIYVFSYTAHEELYQSLLPDVEKMLDCFVFDTAYEPDFYLKPIDTSLPAPEGMKLASNDDVAYRFYVPSSWSIDQDQRIFAAYVKEDRASVSVVPYSPDTDGMSVTEYFELIAERLANTGEYKLLSANEYKLGERPATGYTYTYTVGGKTYQYLQVIAAYKSMLYSLTYTATPECFDAHLPEVEQMIDAFTFR